MSLPVLVRPPLDNPLIFDLPATGYADTDNVVVKVPSGRDAIIRQKRGTVRTGHVQIVGGRNRLWAGGYQTIGKNRDGSYPATGYRGYGDLNIEVKDGDPGGITHLEGILIDASGGAQSDGFVIAAPNTIVQLAWCNANGLLGSLHDGRHADCLQPSGGCRDLRLDHFTGASHYNNLYIRRENSPLLAPVERFSVRYSNTRGYSTNPAASASSPKHTLRGIALGTQPVDGDCNQHGLCGPANDSSETNAHLATTVVFDHFYTDPASAGLSWEDWFYPHAGMSMYQPVQPALDSRGRVYWPLWAEPNPAWPGTVTGAVHLGPAPTSSGDYCPASSVGFKYSKGIWS